MTPPNSGSSTTQNSPQVILTSSINQKRTLNISGFKKSAPRTTSFGAEFETTGEVRSAAKGPGARIYAPHPSTPPVIPPLPSFPTPEFKTPSLPFARSVEGAHTSSPAAAAAEVTNLFRPKSCRPQQQQQQQQQQGEIMGGRCRPPSSEQSFFGNARFPFDSSSGGDLDDSGYFSEHAADIDRFGSGPNTIDGSAATRFVNSTKRGRPASPSNQDEDIVLQSNRPPQARDLPPKRPCVRRSSPSSHSRGGGPLSARTNTAPMPESAPDHASGGKFVLPPHIPHPMAAMGELPGLEFSETDLARYAALYERGSERWSKAPMEEWVAGADEVLAKFGDMIDMVRRFLGSRTWTICSAFRYLY